VDDLRIEIWNTSATRCCVPELVTAEYRLAAEPQTYEIQVVTKTTSAGDRLPIRRPRPVAPSVSADCVREILFDINFEQFDAARAGGGERDVGARWGVRGAVRTGIAAVVDFGAPGRCTCGTARDLWKRVAARRAAVPSV